MKVKIPTVEIEVSKKEFLTLQLQRQYVKTEQFDSEKLISAFEINNSQNWAKLSLKHEFFIVMRERLDAIVAEQTYETQMLSRSWKEFSEILNQAKI